MLTPYVTLLEPRPPLNLLWSPPTLHHSQQWHRTLRLLPEAARLRQRPVLLHHVAERRLPHVARAGARARSHHGVRRDPRRGSGEAGERVRLLPQKLSEGERD